MKFFYNTTLGLLLIAFNLTNSLYAQFTEITDVLGAPISTNYGSPNGNGLSFYDFNHDGWDDLTISRGSQMPLFFENQNGTFVPATFSIPTSTGQQFMMLLWADLNNDGFEDLFISKYEGPIELWINDGNFNFTNIAPQSGIIIGNYKYNGSAIADYNHDGCLDLFIGKFYEALFETGPNKVSRLYRSNCDGTYTDVTESAGVEVPMQLTFQPVFLDYNNDGWDDIYLINEMDYYQNQLFKNNGDGTFTDVSDESGAGIFIDAMSGTVGDFNNDNHLDIFVTNRPGTGGNNLMVNQGDETYFNQAEELGFSTQYQSWGSVWLDYNNDSWQDIFVSLPFPFQIPGNRFYVNNQGQGFTDERDALGFSADFSDTYTCARGDINNDGYFDLAHSSWHTSPFKLYQNQGGENNFISVSLEGTYSNRNAIGSRIHCYAGGNHYTRYTHCGANLLGQDSRKEIFGLGSSTVVDSLVIEWSRGVYEVYYNVPANQHLYLIEGTTLSQPFEISYNDDVYLCEGDSLVLDAGMFDDYFWNTGENTRFITVFTPGTYFVSVVNQFGFSLESVPLEVMAAPENEIQILSSDISCFGASDGQIEIQISNNPAQSFLWNTNDTMPVINNLSNGLYSFIGVDSFGCTFVGNVAVNEPVPLSAEVVATNPKCDDSTDGSVEVVIYGGIAPYQLDWNGFNPAALSAGVYNFSALDNNGCQLEFLATLTAPDAIEIALSTENAIDEDNPGSATISISGGTPPYQVEWSNGLLNDLQNLGLIPGNYWVSVLDDNECFRLMDFEIGWSVFAHTEGLKPCVIFPNPFDKNLQIACTPIRNFSISIFDAYGKQIYSTSEVNKNLTINTAFWASGVYFMALKSPDNNYFFKLLKK